MTKKRNRLISVGIALLVLIAAALFVIPQKTASAAWIDEATTFTNGDGTQSAPYQISSAAELAYLAQQVNSGITYDENTYFQLTADIDLGGKEWTPIGTKDNQFAGKFSGNGKTIRNLTVGGGDNRGLFAYSSGTIKNLYLENVDITTTLNAGGVCSFNSGIIEGCGVLSGTIICSNPNGGQLGGICEENSGTISRCFSNAALNGANSAGIVFVNRASGVVQDCYNAGTIEGSSSASGINTNNYGKIANCLNFGEVSCENGNAYGICSFNTNNSASVENCYNDSDVFPRELVGGFTNKVTAYGKTTAELCGNLSVLSGFSEDVWSSGSFNPTVSSTGGSLGTQTYTYPSLKDFTKTAATRDVEVYNFSTNDTPDWQEFTYIETVEQYKEIRDKTSLWSGNYVLKNDINFNGDLIRPLGDYTVNFMGKFSGDGHKIYNVTIKPNANAVISAYCGLFGVNSGTIMNLTVEANVSGTQYVGGICGDNYGNIVGCSFSGTVTGTSDYVGGICGSNTLGTVERCAADGTVSGKNTVGGICGENFDGTIKNCFNSCDVTGNEDVGGIIGASSSSTSEASYCISVGNVSGSGKNVGGICGKKNAPSEENDEVKHCYYDGNACEVAQPIGNNSESSMDRNNFVYNTQTSWLCSEKPFTIANKFDNTIWQTGDNTITPDSENSRFGAMKTKYIKLIGVGEEKYANKDGIPVYNFKTVIKDDWQEYTLIENEAQFIAIGKDSASWGKNYVLARDLNLNGMSVSPIGNFDPPFTGKFSGNGYTIKNVKMSAEIGDDGFGLFGKNKGVIMFLSVEGDIRCTEESISVNIGGICGYNDNGGNIYDCSFEGTVRNEGNSNAGGICGKNYGQIVRCYAFADVYSRAYYAGGICGESRNTDQSLGSCYFVGNVIGGKEDQTGAITGNNIQNASYCYYDKERCNASDQASKTTGKTTQELCETKNLFSDDLWIEGSFTATADAGNSSFRTAEYTYPKLKSLKKAAKSGAVKQYNFGIDSADDWREYTIIKNQSDLEKIADNLGGNYVLGADITLSGDFKPIGWNGIFNSDAFTGRFSGDGHTISVDVNVTNGAAGLFSFNRGSIMYLGVKGNISGSNDAGGISGLNNGGTIYCCSFEGKVTGDSFVGGISGVNSELNNNIGTIKNCYVIGDVSGSKNVGGISTGTGDAKVENCYFAGKVTASDTYSPINSYGGTVKNCYYDKEVYGSEVTEDNVTGKTTNELCSLSIDGNYWTAGSYTATVDGKIRTAEYTYPKLKSLKKAAKSGTVKQYNFGIDGNDDWREYTLVSSEAELKAIGNNAESLSKNYVLTKDITLSSGFMPIGGSDKPFTGKFSGDGYTINGKISLLQTGTDVGLFASNAGLIMNLGIDGTFHGIERVGSICGTNSGTIYCCSYIGGFIVATEKNAGGICGLNNGKISNCYVVAERISAKTAGYAGGISGSGSDSSKIENCYFVGTTVVPTGCSFSPICSGGTFSSCSYNVEVYKTYTNSISGVNRLQTTHMTASDALSNMGLSGEIWEKMDNDKENGKAYYPSLKCLKGGAPFEKYEAKLLFVPQLRGKYPDYGDNITVHIYLKTEFDNKINSISLGHPTFTIKIGDKTVVESDNITKVSGEDYYTATCKADAAGEITFTLVCEINDAYLPDNFTTDCKLRINKKTLTASDFTFTAPNNLTYDGTVKSASITGKSAITGCGEIMVKYFDSNGKQVQPINAGEYTVKLDVSGGENCNKSTIEDENWKFTIAKAAAPSINDIDVTYGWKKTGVCTVPVEGVPDDLGTSSNPVITLSDANSIINESGVKFSAGKLTFSFNALTDANIGNNAKITTTITSQNYTDIEFNVNVELNGLKDPSAPKCELTITHDENGAQTYTATIAPVDGAEYKFNDKGWGSVPVQSGIKHGEKVTASIRIKAVQDVSNASEAAVSEKTATDGYALKSDKDGHRYACSKCGYATASEPHAFSGNVCTVCGYKKSGSSGGSSGGGSHSGGSSGGGSGSYTPTNPTIDGKEMSWSDVKDEISKLDEGAEITLSLNGNTTLPKDVIKAIADKKAVATIKVNSTFSWTIDGSKLTESDIKDVDFEVDVVTVSGTDTLRGAVGTGFAIGNITEKATLNISFRSTNSGKFANVFKKVDGKLVFADNVKIDENGKANGLTVHENGEYVVMLGEMSDRPGDMDNDGVLNAKDALETLKHSVGFANGKNPLVADLNGDGFINAYDALMILKMAVGLM